MIDADGTASAGTRVDANVSFSFPHPTFLDDAAAYVLLRENRSASFGLATIGSRLTTMPDSDENSSFIRHNITVGPLATSGMARRGERNAR